jgi:hypothetical protein
MFAAGKSTLGTGTSGPADPLFNHVTLLLQGDGINGAKNNTFLDSSGDISGTPFVFQNVGFNYSVDGFADSTYPDLTLVRERTYYFNFTNVTSSHPIALRLSNGSTSAVPGTTGNDPTNGVFGNGSVSTIVTYQVPLDAPSSIVYQCKFHAGMIGTINIVDQSTITRNGNATQGSFSPYGSNWSNFFEDAPSNFQSLSINYLGAINDFTIEFFINWKTTSDISAVIDISGYQSGISLRASLSGLFIYMFGNAYYSSSFTWTPGKWYHIAVVRSGTTLYWYVDGINISTSSVPSTTIPSAVGKIGHIITGGSYVNAKYISNLRIVNSALYTGSTLTVPKSNLTNISGTILSIVVIN